MTAPQLYVTHSQPQAGTVGKEGSVLAPPGPWRQSPCRGAARGAPEVSALTASPEGRLARRYALSSEHTSSPTNEVTLAGWIIYHRYVCAILACMFFFCRLILYESVTNEAHNKGYYEVNTALIMLARFQVYRCYL